MTPTHQQWAARAQYDLETAKAMLDCGRYLYVMFLCHEAVERMLKSQIVRRGESFPSRTLDLPTLAIQAGLEGGIEQFQFLDELSGYSIHCLYPGESPERVELISNSDAAVCLAKAEAVIQLLSSAG